MPVNLSTGLPVDQDRHLEITYGGGGDDNSEKEQHPYLRPPGKLKARVGFELTTAWLTAQALHHYAAMGKVRESPGAYEKIPCL